MIRRLTIFLAALLLLPLAEACAEDAALTVRASPLDSFTPFPQLIRFGKLEWRGGLILSSDDPRFGGLSSIALSRDGSELLAVSDVGSWFKAHFVYAGTRITGLDAAEMAPILNAAGNPDTGKVLNDAEALAAWEPGMIGGKMIVGFERRVRAGLFEFKPNGFNARFQDLKLPAEVARGPSNEELESIGRFASGPFAGSLIAISERNLDNNGDIRAWIWGGKRRLAFGIKQYEDYAITDLAILPNGDLLTVERSFGASRLPGMAIRRFSAADIVAGGAIAPILLFAGRAPLHAVDNMEGIALFQNAQGETIVTLLSDDNFNKTIQRTLILQFALLP
ncbi:esterase-like activity of phytase family protein [soil metagenome]